MRDLETWYTETTGADSLNQVAKKTGINQSTLFRQLENNRLSNDNIALIARAYGTSVIRALLISGMLVQDDIDQYRLVVEDMSIEKALKNATDRQIALEVWYRLDGVPEGEHPVFDQPVSDSVQPDLEIIEDDPHVNVEEGTQAASTPRYKPDQESDQPTP